MAIGIPANVYSGVPVPEDYLLIANLEHFRFYSIADKSSFGRVSGRPAEMGTRSLNERQAGVGGGWSSE